MLSSILKVSRETFLVFPRLFSVVFSDLCGNVRMRGPPPGDLQRPGCHFVGKIRRTGKRGLIEARLTVAQNHDPFGVDQLHLARARERQFGKFTAIGHGHAISEPNRSAGQPAFTKTCDGG